MEGEIEVFTHSAGNGRRASRFLSRMNGRWVRVRAVIDGSRLQLDAVNPLERYHKIMALSESSACSVSTQNGRANCIVVTGFNRDAQTRRVFDCLSIEARNHWQTAIIGASALGGARGAAPHAASASARPTTAVVGSQLQVLSRHQDRKTLDSFLRWHEQWRRTPVFRAESKAKRRWWAAVYLVGRDVKERYGYTSLELIHLQKKLTNIGIETMSEIKSKARRIIKQFVRDHRQNNDAVREKFQAIVQSGARAKGLSMPVPRFDQKASSMSLSGSGHLSTTRDHASLSFRSSGSAANDHLVGQSSHRASSRSSHHHHREKSYLDSGFRKQLQILLRKEHVLAKLTRTLEMIRRKERHQFVLADAMRGLWVARCVRALLNLPGGLAAVLAMPQERGSLRRLLAAALLCRVPLLTTLVLEMLAALLLLPGREGSYVVLNVISQIDRAAVWGKPLCSDYLLRASPEALRWSNAANKTAQGRHPPPFVALATLLHDTPEHNCCPELRSAVVSLFAALCRSEPTRSAAQWTQARIFHACRAALTVTIPKFYTIPASGSFTSESDSKERARRRRSEIGLERAAFGSVSSDVGLGDYYAAGQQNDRWEEDPDLHPCPPLMKLLELERHLEEDYNNAIANGRNDNDNHGGYQQFFLIQLEHFLDGWDKRELDEADDIDELPVGSAERTELLCERIRRSVLLLGRYSVIDEALHAFALDLEHGAFLPFDRLHGKTSKDNMLSSSDGDNATTAEDQKDSLKRITLDMNATIEAVCRLQRGAFVGRGVQALVGAVAKQSSHSDNMPAADADHRHPHVMGPSSASSKYSSSSNNNNTTTRSSSNNPDSRIIKRGGPPVKDDPRFARYFRMIKLHIPKLAVAAKLAQDGLDPAILDLDPNEPAPDTVSESDDIDQPATDDTSLTSEVALENDSTYAPYFRMLKMHVPRQAVETKMRDLGLDPTILDLDPTEPAPRTIVGADDDDFAEDGTIPEDDENLAEKRPKPKGCSRAPKHRLRKVFWDVVSDATGTLWDDDDDDSVVDLDEEEEDEDHEDDDDAAQKKLETKKVSPHYALTNGALEELELVFGPAPRRGEVSKADKSAEAAAQKKRLFEDRLLEQSGQIVNVDDQEVSLPNSGHKSLSLIAEALGEKRAFALNLLYGSLRTSNDECIAAVASLDPSGAVFVAKLPRLGTLYNMLSRKEDLVHLEYAAVRVGILDNATKTIKEKDQEFLLKDKYDGLTQLLVGLLDRARRPRAKIQALWLYATVKDRACELSTSIANFERCAMAIRHSQGLKKILKVTLAMTNFLNYGSDRGANAGVRISALSKLQTTRTTKGDKIAGVKNLLQFVVRHADVSSSTLKHEIPTDLLNSVRNGQSREAIADLIDQLRHERDDAASERGVLSREATTQAPGVDARRVAVAAAAAARMAQIVADVDDDLAGLDSAYSSMDNTVDATLKYFGEPNPAATDVSDWLRQLEAFLNSYDAEYAEFREHLSRREKRNLLAKKQRDREQMLTETSLNDDNNNNNAFEDATSDAGASGAHLDNSNPKSPTSPSSNQNNNNQQTKRASTRFDRLVTDAGRMLAGDNSTYQTGNELDLLHVCAQCKTCNHATMPGAFAKDDPDTWYCADCWWDFSLINPDWKNELGEDTTPAINNE